MSGKTEILYTRRYRDDAVNLLKPEAFPLYTATAFGANSLSEIKEAYRQGYTYIRTNNPDREVLANQVTALEAPGMKRESLIFSSGMASISNTLEALLSPGDHIITHRSLYGETQGVLKLLKEKMGVESDSVDLNDPQSVRRCIRPNTRLLYAEVCANPNMDLVDIPAVAQLAHEHGLLLMMDNTFTSAVSIKPLTLGADIVISSMTKFMCGHSDVILGCMTSTPEIVEKVYPVSKLLGTPADPFPCWQAIRSLETLFLRVETQMRNAAALAAFFESDPHVVRVNHPSLDSFPQRDVAKKLWKDDAAMAGIMSIVLNTEDEAKMDAFMRKLKYAHYATTLGGIHTTLNHPCTSSHRNMPDDQRRAVGITPAMLRVSVGIEDVEDLKEDFHAAFAALDA